MLKPFPAAIALSLAVAIGACAAPRARSTVAGTPSRKILAEFWSEPGKNRDLYWGPWGREHSPRPDVIYKLEGVDDGGYSPKWKLTGPDGREWSAKMGPEAQSEVTASRILWAVGYHQPPNYYLKQWRVENGTQVQHGSPARFRPALEELDGKGDWPWLENPFVETPQYRGLLVLLALLNSADLKDNNNTVYELPRPREGRAAGSWCVTWGRAWARPAGTPTVTTSSGSRRSASSPASRTGSSGSTSEDASRDGSSSCARPTRAGFAGAWSA